MRYLSTRGESSYEKSIPHILEPFAADGGFIVPERLPYYDAQALKDLRHLTFAQRLARIFALFIHEIDENTLYRTAQLAFETDQFAVPEIARLVDLNPYAKKEYLLELGHGPAGTYADIAWQFLPHFLDLLRREQLLSKDEYFLTGVVNGEEVAALLMALPKLPTRSGTLFYAPRSLSYEAQQVLAAATQDEDLDLTLHAVHGDFEQLQATYHAWLTQEDVQAKLTASAQQALYVGQTSWFMLLIKIVCFISAYVDLIDEETFPAGASCNLVLPEGDMSFTLAAWYARQMGLPFRKIICTTNRNKVLADFFATGAYQINREAMHTNTPSLDHCRPVAMERFLFEISGHKQEAMQAWREDLMTNGKLQLEATTLRRLQAAFASGYTDNQGVNRGLRDFYDQFDYGVDPHTALQYTAYARYRQKTKDETKTIYLSMMNLLHGGNIVAKALLDGKLKAESLACLAPLSQETGIRIPPLLKRFSGEVEEYKSSKMQSELFIDGDPESLKLLPKTVPTAEDIERAKRHAQEDEERQKYRPKNLPQDARVWVEQDLQKRPVLTLDEAVQKLTNLLI